jgi:hypothetical protein
LWKLRSPKRKSNVYFLVVHSSIFYREHTEAKEKRFVGVMKRDNATPSKTCDVLPLTISHFNSIFTSFTISHMEMRIHIIPYLIKEGVMSKQTIFYTGASHLIDETRRRIFIAVGILWSLLFWRREKRLLTKLNLNERNEAIDILSKNIVNVVSLEEREEGP